MYTFSSLDSNAIFFSHPFLLLPIPEEKKEPPKIHSGLVLPKQNCKTPRPVKIQTHTKQARDGKSKYRNKNNTTTTTKEQHDYRTQCNSCGKRAGDAVTLGLRELGKGRRGGKLVAGGQNPRITAYFR
jgi:hypothetical protein